MSQQPRHGYAADLPHGLQVGFGKPHWSSLHNGKQRDALRPAHIHQVGVGAKVEGRKRRFLAYSSPSRSPDPHHLAVLTRPGFVRAAPTLPGTTRIRLPSATPTCCDRPKAKVFHLHSKHSASRRKPESWQSRKVDSPGQCAWTSRSTFRMAAISVASSASNG